VDCPRDQHNQAIIYEPDDGLKRDKPLKRLLTTRTVKCRAFTRAGMAGVQVAVVDDLEALGRAAACSASRTCSA
jgi:hypothetical protein